jgi:putative protease
MKKPELLAPAGNLEKLKIAFRYGADAVYVGGHVFGLRKYADNFTDIQLAEGVAFAHSHNKRIYVVLNGFAHTADLDDIVPALHYLNTIQPDGLIISDMGVFQLAKKFTNIPLHVSTQASVTSRYGCQFWKDAGAKRIILAREVSVSDCAYIKQVLPIELEIFVHGAMCASYSGKCVISNYTSGRDSNRGGCVQSCRHTYEIKDVHSGSLEDTTHIMNAKDLMGIRQLPSIIRAGIDSVKVEGRMKSNLYVANISRIYRKALDAIDDALLRDPEATFTDDFFLSFETELQKVSNRGFSSGGLEGTMQGTSIHYTFSHYNKSVDYIGTVKTTMSETVYLAVKTGFNKGDTLLRMSKDGEIFPFVAKELFSTTGDPLARSMPNSLVKIPTNEPFESLDVICKNLE